MYQSLCFIIRCYWSLSIFPKNIRKALVFRFQGISKEPSGMKWVKKQIIYFPTTYTVTNPLDIGRNLNIRKSFRSLCDIQTFKRLMYDQFTSCVQRENYCFSLAFTKCASLGFYLGFYHFASIQKIRRF